MDFDKIIKIISRTITFSLMGFFLSSLYLEYKGHVFSDGFDLIGRLGLRSEGAIREKSLHKEKTKDKKELYAQLESEKQEWSDAIKKMVADRVLGNEDSDVTIYEFSSYDCPACSRFHNNTLSQIKEKYIESNKFAFVFKDFPLRNIGFSVALLSRCINEKEYYRFVDSFMKRQNDFLYADDALKAIKKYAQDFGLTADEVDKCTSNQELFAAISYFRKEAELQYDINSTPTIIIENKNGKHIKIVGVKSFQEFEEVLDNFLNKP